jgi:hypothetical protein
VRDDRYIYYKEEEKETFYCFEVSQARGKVQLWVFERKDEEKRTV